MQDADATDYIWCLGKRKESVLPEKERVDSGPSKARNPGGFYKDSTQILQRQVVSSS